MMKNKVYLGGWVGTKGTVGPWRGYALFVYLHLLLGHLADTFDQSNL